MPSVMKQTSGAFARARPEVRRPVGFVESTLQWLSKWSSAKLGATDNIDIISLGFREPIHQAYQAELSSSVRELVPIIE